MMLCGAYLSAQEEAPPREESRGSFLDREVIGIRTVVSAGIAPVANHTSTDNVGRNLPTAFSIEFDVLYQLPFDRLAIDVGIGLRYLFTRTLGNGQTYEFAPLYAIVQLPFDIPSLQDILSIYIDGRIGYSFFIPSATYRASYLPNTTEAVGGLYFGIGLGVEYTIVRDFFGIHAAAIYHSNGVNSFAANDITDTLFEVLLGISFTL